MSASTNWFIFLSHHVLVSIRDSRKCAALELLLSLALLLVPFEAVSEPGDDSDVILMKADQGAFTSQQAGVDVIPVYRDGFIQLGEVCVWGGVLAQDLTIQGVPCAEGGRITMGCNGLTRCVLSKSHIFGLNCLPEGTDIELWERVKET